MKKTRVRSSAAVASSLRNLVWAATVFSRSGLPNLSTASARFAFRSWSAAAFACGMASLGSNECLQAREPQDLSATASLRV